MYNPRRTLLTFVQVALCVFCFLGGAALGQAATPADEGTRALKYIIQNDPAFLMNIFHLTQSQLAGSLAVKQLIATGNNTTDLVIWNPTTKQEAGAHVDYSTGKVTMLVPTQNVLLYNRLSVAQVRSALQGSGPFGSDLSDYTIKEAIGYSNNIYKIDAQRAYEYCVRNYFLPPGMNSAVLFMSSPDMGVDPKMLIALSSSNINMITINRSQFEAIEPSQRVSFLTVAMAHEGTHIQNQLANPSFIPLEDECLAQQASYLASLSLFGSSDKYTRMNRRAYETFDAVVKNKAQVCAMFGIPVSDFKKLYYRGINPSAILTLYDTRNNREVSVQLTKEGDLVRVNFSSTLTANTVVRSADGTAKTQKTLEGSGRRPTGATAVHLATGAPSAVLNPSQVRAADGPQVSVRTVRPGVMHIQVGQNELFQWSQGRLVPLNPKTKAAIPGSQQPASMSGTPGKEMRLQFFTQTYGQLELTLNGKGALTRVKPVQDVEELENTEPLTEPFLPEGRRAEPKLPTFQMQ